MKKTNDLSKIISNVDKIFWPREKITKGHVLAYYDEMAQYILPFVKDRPQSLHRYPNGVRANKFIQKNVEGELPDFAETIVISSESEERDVRYILCQNRETLIYLANLACIELHVWNSRRPTLDYPDFAVIDLDPVDVPFSKVVQVALAINKFLESIKISSYCRTSGSRGLHIYIPLAAHHEYEQVKNFTHLLVTLIHQQMSDITSLERSPDKRRHKVYLDYLQNRFGQTMPSVYSLRALPGAPVATPLDWDELTDKLNPQSFTMFTIMKRVHKKGDLWQGIFKRGLEIKDALSKLELGDAWTMGL